MITRKFLLRTLQIFILQISFSAVYSQSAAFSVLFQNPVDDRALDVLEDSIGTYYAVGYAGYNSQPQNFRGLAYRIRSSFDTLSRRISFSDTTVRFFKILKGQNQNFLVLGSICNPPDYYERLLVLKMDKNLNIISRKEYQLSNHTKIERLEYLSGKNSSFIIYGSLGIESDPQMDFFLCKMNGEGDTLKTAYYVQNSPLAFTATYNLDTTRIWIFGSGFNWYLDGQRAEFDTSLNFNRLDQIPSTVYPNMNIKVVKRNTMLFGGCYTFFTPKQNDDIGISYMDTLLNTPSIHYFGSVDTIDNPGAERFLDFITPSRIFYAGIHNLMFDFFPQGISWIMTGVLDSTLNPVYQTYYGGDAYYIQSSLLATKDGGHLIVGTRYDYNTQNYERDVIFLKFDANGSITGIPFTSRANQIYILYPNPGNNFILVKGDLQGYVFELFTLNGEQLLSKKLENGINPIATSNLSTGQGFIYKIVNNRNNVFKGKWIKN